MKNGSLKRDDREEQKGDELQDSPNGFETEDKDVHQAKGDCKALRKRARDSSTDTSPRDNHSSKALGVVGLVDADSLETTKTRKPETSLAGTATPVNTTRLPNPVLSAKTLERVKAELTNRKKRRLTQLQGTKADKNSESDEKQGSAMQSKNSGEESDEGPLPNKYREEFRNGYKQLTKQRKMKASESKPRSRTKRSLTGQMPTRVVPTIKDCIWRLQHETGCLPGGPNEFVAPKRQDYDVCESLDRAGYIGIGLLAKKLGYHAKEMKNLGGYGIEVETDDRLEMSWCPPGSEYSRFIATKLPSNAGLWVVDVERSFEYDGKRPFQMPSWHTVGPFENIEDAVAEAKKQVGAHRSWEWEQVSLDAAFEIRADNATRWEGHWNPPGHEYSRVSVKMIGWPEPRTEYTCSWEYANWRKALGLAESGKGKDEVHSVKWHESS